jgi:RimJ/RimL family protein N-acetyltransferase
VADYNANGTYYTEPVYTGWQTIDGKVYYYTSNHQRVTGSQVISGISYNFGSDGALQQGSGKNGIDVSSHQGNIDWTSFQHQGYAYEVCQAIMQYAGEELQVHLLHCLIQKENTLSYYNMANLFPLSIVMCKTTGI